MKNKAITVEIVIRIFAIVTKHIINKRIFHKITTKHRIINLFKS